MYSVSAALFSQTQFTQTSFYGESLRSRLPSSAQDDNALVNASLSQGLKRGLGVELDETPGTKEAKAPGLEFDVDKVVDTVMQFVEKRVEQARVDGASDEELESMLDAARSGVETGFSQARDQINALGKMNDQLGERIDAAENGIYQGIDELEDSLLEDDDVVVSLPPAPTEAPDKPKTGFSYASAYQRNTETFDFQLTTQDGDVVTISAYNDQAFYAESYKANGQGGSLRYGALAQAAESGFSLQVQGDLDDDELLAIQDLLSQVDALAEEFYTGDLGTAFDMALQLQSDPSEIAKFSLDLTQSQSTYVEMARFKPVSSYEAPSLPRGLAEPLSNFANGVREAFESASRFSQPAALLDQLFDQFDQQKQIPNLLEPLLNQLTGE